MGLFGWLFGTVKETETETPVESAPPEETEEPPGFPRTECKRGHFTDYVEDVKELKRQGRNVEALGLLLQLIGKAESEEKRKGSVTPPWYIDQACIVCRKLIREGKGVEILDTFPKRKYTKDALAELREEWN